MFENGTNLSELEPLFPVAVKENKKLTLHLFEIFSNAAQRTTYAKRHTGYAFMLQPEIESENRSENDGTGHTSNDNGTGYTAETENG